MGTKTENEHEREENYRFFRLGDDLRDVTRYPGLDSNAVWRTLRFFYDSALYFRERLSQVAYSFEADQDLLERAIDAASSDKLGECLATLYRIRELRKVTLAEINSLIEKHRKAAQQDKSYEDI